MADNFFDELNKQRIPEEARTALLAGEVDFTETEIRIGSFTFPRDTLHRMEVDNVIEGAMVNAFAEAKALRGERDDAGNLKSVHFYKLGIQYFSLLLGLITDELKYLPENERDRLANRLKSMMSDFEHRFKTDWSN